MINAKKTNSKSGFLTDFGQKRLLTHLALFIFSLIAIGLTFLYEPTSQLNDIISLGTGYASLILLVVTLSVGTFNLVLKRKNPVNVNFRRDAGIWCGITGVIHGLISFTLYNSGNVLAYFLTKTSSGSYTTQFNLNSLSNILGVLALLIMLVLLITSNNLSMRYLKGKSWKFLQRFNYPLFILTIAHTIGYIVLNSRESFFTFLLTALVFFTILAQLIGIIITVQREGNQAKEEAATQAKRTPSLNQDDVDQNLVARRRFLVLAGVTLVAGIGSSASLSAALLKQNNNNGQTNVASNVSSSSSGASATQIPATSGSSNGGSVAVPTVTSSSSSSSANSTTTVATGSETAATTSTTTTSSAASTTTAATVKGTKIVTLSSFPVNSAVSFTTPDTNATTLVIHEQDGSVKAFSNICTHRPYQLVYQSNTQTLFCALHSANFDPKTGAVLNGPPPTGLQSFNVQVDAQGNVVYVQS